jgi:hypothetical protein
MVRHAATVSAALVLLLSALLPAAARADEVTSYAYDVEETFTITLDARGNARFKDVLEYDAGFFNTNGFDFEQYPFLLSRRHNARAAVNEIQDFTADLDRQNATVTLTYGQRGKAYNMGGHWTVYGFYEKPAFVEDDKRIFQEESTVNSDYTLWQDLEFKTTTIVELPPGASNVRWSKADSALLYELPYTAPPQGNVVQTNQAVFIPLFAILAAGSLAVGVVTLVSARRRPAAQPATTGEPVPEAASPPPARSAAGFGFSPTAPAPSAGAAQATTTGAAGQAGGARAAAAGPAGVSAGVDGAVAASTAAGAEAARPSVAEQAQPGQAVGSAGAEASSRSLAVPLAPEAPAAHFCRHCGAALDHPDCSYCPSCGGRLRD